MTLEHEHTADAIRKRLSQQARPNYLRDWIYGGIDGTITTFAIVAGVVGANLSAGVILVLGLANLLADGFSMAASNYSGTKSEIDEAKRLRKIEEKHIEIDPEGEKEEMRQILEKKGLTGDLLEQTTETIIADKDIWIDTMMVEEYGISPVMRNPWMSALSTFTAFFICGAVPLLPYILPIQAPFFTAIFLTAIVFFVIGSIKSRWSASKWWISGLETLMIGLIAATIAYGIGYLLKGLV